MTEIKQIREILPTLKESRKEIAEELRGIEEVLETSSPREETEKKLRGTISKTRKTLLYLDSVIEGLEGKIDTIKEGS